MADNLSEGWPHKHLLENPEELHICPRTAYYVVDGKVVFHRLEDLGPEDTDPVFSAFHEGVLPHEM